MTVKEFSEKFKMEIVTDCEADAKEITGAYVCDLLSWAMARVNKGDLWVTVHTHLNVIGVAALTEAACVIIPESISIEENSIKKAQEQGVTILRTSASAYDICLMASTFLKQEK